MIAEILTIGNEILVGSILNTNSRDLSSKLTELGIETQYHTSVEDNEERLSNTFNIALGRADLIITTGGLGPTYDDLTKEVIAKSLSLKLIEDDQARKELELRFSKPHRQMCPNNIKQAFRPEGSQFITNDNGTAPGIFLKMDKKIIIMLPGPPKECIPMFENYVAKLIKNDNTIIIKSINTIGIGESDLEAKLSKLNLNDEIVYYATFAKIGGVEIKIIGKGLDKELVESKVNDTIKKIESKFIPYIYSYDNEPLEKLIINKLKNSNKTLAVCESCTGGNLALKFLSIPGASSIFDRGLITYSNKSKVDELNVNTDTLTKYGAVSKETAYEMAKGLLDKTNVDYVISTTGIAGPEGGSHRKPVGLVYICIMSKDDHKIIDNIYMGNRKAIQERSSLRALFELYKFIK